MKNIRIAAVVFRSPVGKVEDNLARTAFFVEEARKNGASIICFPEMNITGYSTQKTITESSDTIPGSISTQLEELSMKSGLAILAGMAETDKSGRLYASHLVVTPDRQISVYRKVHLAPPEQRIYSPADRVAIFEAFGVKFGIQLCYDAHFPELSTCMAEAGADILFFPHASPKGSSDEKLNSWTRHLPARAFDNSMFVVACNQTGDNENGLEFPGVALTIGPSGEVLNKKVGGGESLLISDLKSSDLARVRNHKMRYFLPNRRPGLKDLLIK